MLHKARARNARPYGHGGVMHSYFFRNIVGARIARPLSEFAEIYAKFRICSFTVPTPKWGRGDLPRPLFL